MPTRLKKFSGGSIVAVARARYQRGSPRKFRLVANELRGKPVSIALGYLHLSKRRASSVLDKLLRSAISNAQDRDADVDVDQLYVTEAFVDPGPSMPLRIRPQPMGRAYPIIKRTSHITIRLAEKES